jgi:UDP-glucuronate 4-epimerase
MKILITGAAGFIGYHLVKRLVQEVKNTIIGIDNINNCYDQNLKYARLTDTGICKENVKDLLSTQSTCYPNYLFIKLDVTDKVHLTNLFTEFYPDIVVNLAAQAGVRYSLDNPHSYVQSNVVGFMNILECCRYNNIKHLIYASSSSVYGNSEQIPFSETQNVDYPVSLYAATKKANELMAHTYSYLYHLPTTGLRFFTVYGPWGRPDMAPILFAKAISENNPIKVFCNGDLSRDFTFVDDIVESTVRLLNAVPTQDELYPYYRILNVGNSQPVNLMDFIHIMEDAFGKKAILEMYPMQAGDVKITYADTSALEKITKYKPSTSLKNGIEKFVEWYNNYTKQI